MKQDIVLYPGDRLLKRTVFNLQDRIALNGSCFDSDSVFQACFLGNFVGLGRFRYDNSIYISSCATQPFSLDVQLQQEFFSKHGESSPMGDIARSNVIRLEYVPPTNSVPLEVFESKRRNELWEKIDNNVGRGKKNKRVRRSSSKNYREKKERGTL